MVDVLILLLLVLLLLLFLLLLIIFMLLIVCNLLFINLNSLLFSFSLLPPVFTPVFTSHLLGLSLFCDRFRVNEFTTLLNLVGCGDF